MIVVTVVPTMTVVTAVPTRVLGTTIKKCLVPCNYCWNSCSNTHCLNVILLDISRLGHNTPSFIPSLRGQSFPQMFLTSLSPVPTWNLFSAVLHGYIIWKVSFIVCVHYGSTWIEIYINIKKYETLFLHLMNKNLDFETIFYFQKV